MERETERAMGGEVTTEGKAWNEPSLQGQQFEPAIATGEEAVREVKETLEGTKEKASAAYERAASEMNRAYQGAREYARDNPGVAAAVTFAAGIGLGLMLSGRAYRRGIVPVAAVALAHAVLDVFE